MEVNTPDQTFWPSGSDAESRPKNMYMDFIIKLKNTKPGDDNRMADLPAGSVFPFSGTESTFPDDHVDHQYVECDGANVIADSYPDLVKAVGRVFSTSNHDSEFTSPDLRDYFIRGISDDGKYDPDYSRRNKVSIKIRSWETRSNHHRHRTALRLAVVPRKIGQRN